MKPLQFALLLTVAMAFASTTPAQARPVTSHHSGTSSYKSGFSSQKSNSPRQTQAAPAADRQSGPGAFGRASGSPASATPPGQPRQSAQSAMSRDMDQNAAQANALRTLDARRATAAGPASGAAPLPPLNDTAMRPQPAPVYQTPPMYQQPTVIVQQPSSGLMNGMLGFMLGRAMSHNNQTVVYTNGNGAGNPGNGGVVNGNGGNGNNGGGNNNGNGNGGDSGNGGNANNSGSGDGGADGNGKLAGMPGLGDPADVAAAAAAAATAAQARAAPAPSFGASVLRLFAWLSVIGLMVWTVVYSVRKLRRLRAGNATNYSFERN